MIRKQIFGSILLLTVALSGIARAEDTLRLEVGKPMQAAQDLIKAQKYKEALARIRDAEGVPNRTAYENFIIERMRAAAATGAGDTDTAVKSYEAILNTGKLSAPEQLKIMEALAGTYYRARDYGRATTWVQSYLKNGGSSPQVRILQAQAMYLAGDASSAAKEVSAMILADEKSGATPAENLLQLLASCQQKTNDTAGYIATTERLLRYHPKPEYWADIISRIRAKPGFPDRALLDVYRLQQASDNLKDGAAYVEFAQLAIQDGFPAEAKKIIAEGYDRKLLGTGADAARHKRLQDLASRMASDDRVALDQNKTADKDAIMLVNNGYAYVTHGEVDKGVGMMERAIAKGGLKRPEDATLHLGLAYLQSGNRAKALQTLKSLTKNGSVVGDLARLWVLQARLE